MKVSIVIPNWNGIDKLKRNLPEVLKVKGVDEIVIADDASSDGSVDFIESNYPQIKLIKSNLLKNRGFASNVNIGFKGSSGDIIFLLNSDAVPRPNCIEVVLPHFKDLSIFSISCNTGGTWSWAEFKNGFFWHKQALQKVKVAHQTLWASGGSGIFRKSIWDELDGLDEMFNPFYEEDVDIGYRATKRGYINLWDPNCVVEHYKEKGVIAENYSKDKISSIAQRNQLYFIWKNITDLKLISEHKFALFKMLLRHPKYWSVFGRALLKLPRILEKRNIERGKAKLTDKQILTKFS